jgi:hypothetical protein
VVEEQAGDEIARELVPDFSKMVFRWSCTV